MRFAGRFEGVRIFESSRLGTGYDSGGLALPGIGILVGLKTFSQGCDPYLVRHEFGHFLQARQVGLLRFYLIIGPRSLWSAINKGHGRGHRNYWTETWANGLAKGYFQDSSWPEERFPVDYSTGNKRRPWWI